MILKFLLFLLPFTLFAGDLVWSGKSVGLSKSEQKEAIGKYVLMKYPSILIKYPEKIKAWDEQVAKAIEKEKAIAKARAIAKEKAIAKARAIAKAKKIRKARAIAKKIMARKRAIARAKARAKARARKRAMVIANNTVTLKGLMWQDNRAVKRTKRTWQGAKSYCENLKLFGFHNWKLPTKTELKSIVDKRKRPAIKQKFKHIMPSFYWSSSPNLAYSRDAWGVNFLYGYLSDYNKMDKYYVRCIRIK